MNNSRLAKVNDEIRKVVAEVLRSEIKDPRVPQMVSVIKADTTNDLKYCKIWVSIMGDEDVKKEALAGIKSAAGFVRKRVAESVNLRATPEFTFHIDDSLDHSDRINKLLNEI